MHDPFKNFSYFQIQVVSGGGEAYLIKKQLILKCSPLCSLYLTH